jgi:5-methylthioadenosine/S-adenosylhomocysteine deaminase
MALFIKNATLVLPDAVIPRGYMLIDGDRIGALGPGDPPHELINQSLISNLQYPHFLDATNKLVLPGLVNAHTHLEQTFMRGYAANRSLLDWLKNYIWKLQAAMTLDDIRLACLLGMVEALRGGATTVVHHYKLPFSAAHSNVVLETAEKLGLRLVLARAWADRGTNAESTDAILADLEHLFGDWHGAADGRIHIANGPLAPWRCSAETLLRATELARRHGAITHCHMNETQDEVAMTLKDESLRPIEWFDALGLLGEDFHAVHGVWLSDRECELLAQRGATVAHCPAANMILASGVAPVAKLLKAGVNVALATDGPASNDGQDMIETMRLAAYLARVSTLDPQALSPRQAIDMATVHGAKALRQVEIGALAVGAKADLVLLDLEAAHIQPVGDPLASVVYNARGSDVDTVIVNGRILIQDRQVIGLDEAALLGECRERAAHLARRAGLPSPARGGILTPH